jgi:hypothetical protein
MRLRPGEETSLTATDRAVTLILTTCGLSVLELAYLQLLVQVAQMFAWIRCSVHRDLQPALDVTLQLFSNDGDQDLPCICVEVLELDQLHIVGAAVFLGAGDWLDAGRVVAVSLRG